LVKADGVHLGQTDLPVKIIRQMIPIDMLIGCSVTSLSTAKQAQKDGADYLAVSGIYPTDSKAGVTPLGTGLITRVKKVSDLPLVAIGGIKLEHIKELKSLGVDSIAVISAVLGAKSPEAAARQMTKKFGGK
ncbi:MAG: thiamine phosphate synthase, partial [Dehalococcoidales bacterium]|nr:thiamine phosphate synthase [Dehalococcoidales bacterium]